MFVSDHVHSSLFLVAVLEVLVSRFPLAAFRPQYFLEIFSERSTQGILDPYCLVLLSPCCVGMLIEVKCGG